jgi:integrase
MPKRKEREPLEVVTVKGHSVVIYFTPSRKKGKEYPGHTLVFTAAGKRDRKFVTDFDDAVTAAKGIAEQLAGGTGHVHALMPAEVADYQAAMKILRQHPGSQLAQVVAEWSNAKAALGNIGSIAEAATAFARAAAEAELPQISVPDLVRDLLSEKEELSESYVDDITRRLNLFAGAFRVNVGSVTTDDIRLWLKSIGATGRNSNNYRNTLATLFSYARERGFLSRNKKTEVELLKKKKEDPSEIGIYTPDEIAKILNAAPASMKPVIAIGAFAGLRPTEILRLDWKDVKLDKGFIEVHAKNAKTASRRLVPISANLALWLEQVEDRTGRVSPEYRNLTNLSRAVAKACTDAGLEMVSNGLRHSCASYRLALVKSAAQVALEMGNSPKKLFSNYRELVTEGDAKIYFEILPLAA